jgi:hypothetical protein
VVVHFAADTVSGFKHDDRLATLKELSRCCETRKTSTDNGNVH